MKQKNESIHNNYSNKKPNKLQPRFNKVPGRLIFQKKKNFKKI